MRKYQSNAKWPNHVSGGITSDNVSTDTHHTYKAANAVCKALEENGLGGDGEVFPIETWVSNVDESK